MVIQRWQSLLLFISLVLISIFSVSNYGTLHTSDAQFIVNASNNTGYWFFNLAIILLLLVSIFMFKMLNVQKLLVAIATIAMGADAIWGYKYLHLLANSEASVSFGASWILLIVAFGLTIISFFLICADQKLLRSYDRLR